MWIGADWDSEKCVVAFKQGGRLRQRSVRRHPDAVREFMETLGVEDIKVGIEAGDHLWQRLWRNAGADVYVFDGKKSRRFSESLSSSGARDDARAAADILAMVQSPVHRQSANQEQTPELRGLGHVHRANEHASRDVLRQRLRLLSQLGQFYPGVVAKFQKRLGRPRFLAMLEAAPTAAAWADLTEEDREKLMKGVRMKDRESICAALADDWLAVDPAEEDAARFLIRNQVRAVKAALERHRLAETALADAVDHIDSAQLASSFQGIGPVLGGALALAAGDGSGGRDGIAIKLGSAPVTARSGKRGDISPQVSLRRSADTILRKCGYLIGLQLAAHYGWAKAQYEYHRGRGKRAADACRRVVRSFSRILHAMIRDGSVFDEATYIRRLRQNGVPWALGLELP